MPKVTSLAANGTYYPIAAKYDDNGLVISDTYVNRSDLNVKLSTKQDYLYAGQGISMDATTHIIKNTGVIGVGKTLKVRALTSFTLYMLRYRQELTIPNLEWTKVDLSGDEEDYPTYTYKNVLAFCVANDDELRVNPISGKSLYQASDLVYLGASRTSINWPLSDVEVAVYTS